MEIIPFKPFDSDSQRRKIAIDGAISNGVPEAAASGIADRVLATYNEVMRPVVIDVFDLQKEGISQSFKTQEQIEKIGRVVISRFSERFFVEIYRIEVILWKTENQPGVGHPSNY
jgi:hypothetical protein